MTSTPTDLPPWIALYPPAGSGTRAEQLAEQVRRAIAGGALTNGDRLPPSRTLARLLGGSRGVVVAAMEQLCAEGLLVSRPGSGIYVSPDATQDAPPRIGISRQWIAPRVRPPAAAVDTPLQGAIDFRPCRPSLERFPLRDWRRCVGWAAGGHPSSDYADPRGDWSLRAAIARYLRRARGLLLEPEGMMITNGAVHAMHLTAQVYLASRGDAEVPCAVMEDPGYPLARQILESTGAEVLSCPVDEDGLVVEALPQTRSDVRLLYVTPSHQFPLGSRLSLGRRRALVEWANARGVLVIEDDYDGEFRFDVAPLTPLAAIAQGCVVYCGTFSKTLFPDLRIGFAAAHPEQIQALADYRVSTDYSSNLILQRALARFIDEGLYERHIHRMRRMYARKRKVLAEALAELPLPLELQGLDSGLHAVVQLSGAADARELPSIAQLAGRAREAGVLMPRLAGYRHGLDGPDGLVLGYAALSEQEIERGVAVLAV